MSMNYLSKYDELRKGDSLMSNNGEWKAVFQDDGNFVIYGWKSVWTSDTGGSGAMRLVMQADCNLVMYNKCNDAKWHTNSHQPEPNVCHLQLTDEGKLVLDRGCEEIWTSDQSRGMK